MALDMNWVKRALEITGDFETSGNPWAAITGDFDGMGISCGVLQWNIGMGSLQPLVTGVGKPFVSQKMPRFGEELWKACNSPVSQGLQIVRTWQNGTTVKPSVKAELQSLFASAEMVNAQTKRAARLGQNSLDLATKWAKDARNSTQPSLKEFCWFFDLLTLNGGMSDVWLDDVKSFIAAHQPAKVDDVICNWLENYPPKVTVEGRQISSLGIKDAKKNAALWRDNVKPEHLELFVLGFIRATKSRAQFRPVVMNRRGTIATAKGYVNEELENLSF